MQDSNLFIAIDENDFSLIEHFNSISEYQKINPIEDINGVFVITEIEADLLQIKKELTKHYFEYRPLFPTP